MSQQSQYENTKNNKHKKIDKDLDAFIGKKIREKRISLGMTQSKLASYLGVTFQQIQKYEKGTNRISSSMLYMIASVFRVSLQWFIEGFYERSDNSSSLNEDNLVTYETAQDKESQTVLKAYYAIPDPKIRKKVLGIIRAFAPTRNSKDSEEVLAKYTR